MTDRLDRYIDEPLLSLAEWIVKRFNWLTGKDETCLAKIVLRIGLFATAPLLDLISTRGYSLILRAVILILGLLLSIFYGWLMAKLADGLKNIKEDDQIRGIQRIETVYNLKLGLYNFLGRAITRLICTPTIYVFAVIFSSWWLKVFDLVLLVSTSRYIVMTCIIYLLSVNEPPFTKSQLPAWLHSLKPSEEGRPSIAVPA